ncbi:MAG: hypothetical protein LQ340_007352 [Diploschistes diacapsis]|nr:MAG: hypothetical protein LQ340_007352 [Diploschistes diacapsis]
MSLPSATTRNPIIKDLHPLLLTLHDNRWPELPNPPKCKKRASVACLIRIRPRHPDFLTAPSPPPLPDSTSLGTNRFRSQLESFFSLPWVQNGTPEVLFIKRAARRGDRWTSHVALPGGKRDPNDASNLAAAIRETMEEVGIDLSSTTDAQGPASNAESGSLDSTAVHPDPHGNGPEPAGWKQEAQEEAWPPVLLAGPLPQRLITTDFGAIPLMVLCPFVFLLTSPDPMANVLRLQPAEVGSAHWVPIHALIDPGARTYERADLVDRFAVRWGLGWGGSAARWGLRLMLGRMLYSAIRLAPSESVYSDEEGEAAKIAEDCRQADKERGVLRSLAHGLLDDAPWIQRLFSSTPDGDSPDPRRSLLLWGLTQGIVSDLLGLMPSRRDLTWWRWPTLSRPDIRLMTWALGYNFRKRKLRTLKAPGGAREEIARGAKPPVLIEEGIGTAPDAKVEEMVAKEEAGEGESAHGWKEGVHGSRVGEVGSTAFSAAGYMLDGYFEQIQRAIFVTLALRTVVGTAAALYFWRRYVRRP